MASARALAAACWLALLPLVPVTGSGCEDCHGAERLLVENRKLHDYYQDWLGSPYKQAGVGCERCHGGNPAARDKEAAHAGRPRVAEQGGAVFYKQQPATCGQCHPEVAEQFKKSRHCSKVLANELAPSCSTCHRAMNRKPYYRDVLREGCRHCHKDGADGMRPEVVDQADEILHRLNIARGFLGWTALHFQREGWPEDSRPRVEGLQRMYHASLARVHGLELLAADESSAALLAELKRIFKEHRSADSAPTEGAK
jgi:hypothetical protein